MKRQIITTADGSKTILINDWNERYHSSHGAIQESQYVYIEKGLKHFFAEQNERSESISILEMGFGTGLNVILTHQYSELHDLSIDFTTIEAYPIAEEEYSALNYDEQLGVSRELFLKLHQLSWGQIHLLDSKFSLLKLHQTFEDVQFDASYDLIYFDAFGSRVQPELWTISIFKKLYEALRPGGVLVTYAAIGQVKRDMMSLGFKVERLKGPPHKRHMLRATKV